MFNDATAAAGRAKCPYRAPAPVVEEAERPGGEEAEGRAGWGRAMTEDGYDVAILSDLRYPGGNSASIVAEVRAQAAAGLATVLLHVPSPHLKHARPFQAGIAECLRDGLADLAHDGVPVAAKVLVIRQPRIFTVEPAAVPAVRAERTVMVLNQPPGDEEDPERYYRFGEIRARVERLFGTDIAWSPISPRVREQVLRSAPDARLGPDWHEIIDVAQWWSPRERTAGDVPVIGRHGRPDPVKWPRDPADLLRAYPDSGEVRVRMLGGGEIAVQRLGRRPSTWDIVEFGAENPRDFLGTLDFFVYFHDPDWVEAFGRTILEAMAAGVPVVVGPHFRSVFGDAALYTDPAGVLDLVRALAADRVRYRAVVRNARRFVQRRFGAASHITRLGIPASRRPRREGPARSAPKAERILFVADTLDRTLAIVPHLPPGIEAVVATGSERLPEAHNAGLLTEYVPTAAALGATPSRWAAFLRDRLRHLVDLHRACAVVVDGLPHDGILAATADHPDVAWLWIREAMWRRGAGVEWIGRAAAFDAILEPGEFAAAGDEGLTAADRTAVTTVPPIIRSRPVSDLAVASADYTTFHELIGAGVPTVFLPDPQSTLHDELARARFAAAAGAALVVDDPVRLDDVLAEAARPEVRAALAQRCAEVGFANGAADAAAWIMSRVRG
jgi:glycosyltransferase involved in cell wall biosynthesis